MPVILIDKSFLGGQLWIKIDTYELIYNIKDICLRQIKYYQATTLKDPWWDFQEERWIENPWTTKSESGLEDIPF